MSRTSFARPFRVVSAAVLLPAALAAAPAPDLPKPAPRIPAGAWSAALREHPRLLGPRSHLKALAQAKPDLYKSLKSQDAILAAAVVHAVEGLPPDKTAPYLASAKKDVARGVTNVHQDTWIWLENVAFCLDFFHEAIPEADRRAMIDWINPHLEAFTDDESAFHNSTLSKILCYLRIAYATWGENPKAKAFRDHALVRLYEGRVLPVLREFGAGGGFTECGWYTRGSLWHLVQALELARRFEGYDGFAMAPRFFYQRLAYELHQPYPGRWLYGSERYACEGDGSAVYGGHVEYPRHTRTVLAQYFRGSELARATAARHRRASNPAAAIVDFLLDEEPDPALDLAAVPLAHLASGIGKVYARSDWTDDATWLRFECGDFWNNHQHYEVGNFEIFRRDLLAAESGEYIDYGGAHAINWLIRTVAHNGLLVHQPDEASWKQMRDGGRTHPANDGGQAKRFDWVSPTLDAWKAKRESYERGDIVAYANDPAFCYVAGDCTKAYAPSKLSFWIRQIVFLRPTTVVVFDRVVATKPEYAKTWLLHMRREPVVEGSTITIRNGKGLLTAVSLLPEKAAIRAIEGYGYGGQAYEPERKTGLSEEAIRWRIEVQPPAPQAEDLFLHVLSTADAPPTVERVRKGSAVGARIGDAEVLFEGKVGGTLAVGGKTVPLKAEVRTGSHE
jgi:hypothetical protein